MSPETVTKQVVQRMINAPVSRCSNKTPAESAGDTLGRLLWLSYRRDARPVAVMVETGVYPRQDLNLCLRLRRPTLYPLSYGGRVWVIVVLVVCLWPLTACVRTGGRGLFNWHANREFH